jgi:hypothetical protein
MILVGETGPEGLEENYGTMILRLKDLKNSESIKKFLKSFRNNLKITIKI